MVPVCPYIHHGPGGGPLENPQSHLRPALAAAAAPAALGSPPADAARARRAAHLAVMGDAYVEDLENCIENRPH